MYIIFHKGYRYARSKNNNIFVGVHPTVVNESTNCIKYTKLDSFKF